MYRYPARPTKFLVYEICQAYAPAIVRDTLANVCVELSLGLAPSEKSPADYYRDLLALSVW